jgi:hypothetical protein
MITRVPLPEFRPDQSVNSGVLLTCENVYPALDGYRPLRQLNALTNALDEPFFGGYSAIASDGDAYFLAGTASDLYSLTSAGAWTSLVSGLSVTQRWRFAQFGDFVVAVNGAATQEVDLDAGTAAAIAGAPTFTSIAVVGDYVVGGQPDGDINKVRWSSFRDHTAWVNGTNQAGEQPMLTGGAVQFIAGGEYGIILQRERLVRMTRTGDATAPFQFDEISVNYGCADGATVAQSGRTIFFYSDRGFMALEDGQALRNIGSEKVDRAFAKAINRDKLNTLYTAVDPENKIVMWGVPGSPGQLWIYNFELDRWSTGELPFAGIFPGFTTSFTTDDLASLGFTDVDDVGLGELLVDDARWSGGAPRLYFFDLERKAGTLTGDTLAADFELGYNELAPTRQARMRAIRPITDAISGMTARVNAKQRIGDPNDIFTTATLRPSGVMAVRSKGRYHKPQITVDAGTDWTYFQALDIEFEQGGIR